MHDILFLRNHFSDIVYINLSLSEAVATRFDDFELLPDVAPVPELDFELAERRPFFDVDLSELDFFELAERKPFLEVVFEDFFLAAIAF